MTVTWKVHNDILQHIDVQEKGKENSFSLGSSLVINGEEFECLDEILANYVQPMAGFARDLINFRYVPNHAPGNAVDQRRMSDESVVDSRLALSA